MSKNQKKWEKWEIDILKNCDKSHKEIQKLLPHRSLPSIQKKSTKLNLFRNQKLTRSNLLKPWEIDIIKTMSPKRAMIELNKSLQSIYSARVRLGVARNNFWSKEEISQLRDRNVPLGNMKLDRSKSAIKHKAESLGLSRSKKAIKESNSNLTMTQIEELLLNREFNENLDGHLLGDASLVKSNGHIQLSLGGSHLDHVERFGKYL